MLMRSWMLGRRGGGLGTALAVNSLLDRWRGSLDRVLSPDIFAIFATWRLTALEGWAVRRLGRGGGLAAHDLYDPFSSDRLSINQVPS
jgi:hypothetical protein